MDDGKVKGIWKNIKDLYMNKYNRIRYKVREKFTIMLIPHNQKRVRNINLFHWAILLVIVTFLGMVSFSLVIISKYVYLTIKQKEYVAENESMIRELEHLIYSSDNLIHVQKNFSLSLNNLLKTAGLSNEIFFNETGLGGPFVGAKASDLVNKPEDTGENGGDYIFSQMEEIKDLAKMEKEIGMIKEKIQKLSKKLKYFEKVTRYIPSIWPILGDGDIVSSSGAVMTISTLPFTPVVATANGKITRITYEDKKIRVVIRHKYQFISVYSNLYVLEDGIEEGKMVKKGEILGYVAKQSGKTLFDYSIYIGNENGSFPVNPLNFTHLGR